MKRHYKPSLDNEIEDEWPEGEQEPVPDREPIARRTKPRSPEIHEKRHKRKIKYFSRRGDMRPRSKFEPLIRTS